MKTLITILISLILGLLTTKAQTTVTTNSSSVSVTITEDDEEENYSRSFSVIDMERSYKIKVKFMESMQDKVKSYLIEQFGKENMELDSNVYLWKQKIDKDDVYKVELKENRVKINVDKELASNKLIKKIKRIFHPIGQGAFYSERHIGFNVVFDCGYWRRSKKAGNLVKQSFLQTDSIDILFISHYDFDHISQIETLKNRL